MVQLYLYVYGLVPPEPVAERVVFKIGAPVDGVEVREQEGPPAGLTTTVAVAETFAAPAFEQRIVKSYDPAVEGSVTL